MSARILGYLSDRDIAEASRQGFVPSLDIPRVCVEMNGSRISVTLSKDRVKRLENTAEALALEQLREDARKAGVTL